MHREVDLVELMQGIALFGFWRETSLPLVRRDVAAMHDLYEDLIGKAEFVAIKVYILTENDRVDGSIFRVFVGGERMYPHLEDAWVEPGLFAHTVVKPKFGVSWPQAIMDTKVFFHRDWLPASGYRAGGQDFETHSAESRGFAPRVQMYFNIEPLTPSP